MPKYFILNSLHTFIQFGIVLNGQIINGFNFNKLHNAIAQYVFPVPVSDVSITTSFFNILFCNCNT